MPRHKPDPIVRGDDWDPDESAVLKGSYSFMALQRVAFRLAALNELPKVQTEADLHTHAVALTGAIVEMYRGVTLRAAGMPYTEGVERPKVDFTAEALIDEPVETLTWLVERGLAHVAPLLPTRADADGAPLTEAAKGAGLTPETFPADGPD